MFGNSNNTPTITAAQKRDLAVALHAAADEQERIENAVANALAMINSGTAALKQLGVIK